MRGVRGLVIAVMCGVIGAVCNLLYISRQTRDYQKVSFVAIDSSARINRGDRFSKEHFSHVDIPKQSVGDLREVAVLWDDLSTVVGLPATRSYVGGEIVLRQDLKTRAQRDLSGLLGENEALRWVPVDQRSFVAEHVNPGDHVSFIVPNIRGNNSGRSDSSGIPAAGGTETVGPFEIMALGTRKGRRDIFRAEGDRPAHENVIGIRVLLKSGRLNERSERLFEVLRLTNHQGVQVMLHSSRKQGGR
jgi:hypothetical protein